MIIFARQITKENDDGKTKSFPVLSSFTVFHVSQCDGLPESFYMQPEAPKVPSNRVLDWVVSCGARVEHGGSRAFYTTKTDHIQMPPVKAFRDVQNYAATLLHESVHWSGGPKRLAREFGKRFGDDKYAFEELVAEIGAAFLCARLGIVGELQHASYIASWIKVLRGDKRAIFTAASQASRAVDYLFEQAGENFETHGEEAQPVLVAARNVICLPAPAPVLALPSPAMIRAMYGEAKPKPVKPEAKRRKPKAHKPEPIPYPDEYAVRGDDDAVNLCRLGLQAQTKAFNGGKRRYAGAFPLSRSQRAMYEAGIGHASGYWREYVREQTRFPAPDVQGLAMALAGRWEREGHIPSLESVKGCQWLEDWRRKAVRAYEATRLPEAAE